MELASGKPPARIAELAGELSAAHAANGDFPAAVKAAEEGLAKAQEVDAPDGLVVWLGALRASARVYSDTNVEQLGQELSAAKQDCLAAGSTKGGKLGLVRCGLALANLSVAGAQNGEAIKHFRDAANFAATAGDYANQVLALSSAGYFSLLTGELSDAASLLDEGRRVAETHGLLAGLCIVSGGEAELALRQGNLSEAGQALMQTFELADRIDFPDRKAGALAGMAQCELENGNYAQAIDIYERTVGICEDFSLDHQRAICLLGIVESLLALGRKDEIAHRLDTARELIDEARWPSARADLLRLDAMLASANGDSATADLMFNQAAESFAAIGDNYAAERVRREAIGATS